MHLSKNIKLVLDPIYTQVKLLKISIHNRLNFCYSAFSIYYKNRNNNYSAGKFFLLPKYGDNTSVTSFDRHYIYFPSWAIRKITSYNPSHHIDISSSLIFSTMVSAIVPTSFYDYRPADIDLPGLSVGRADLGALPFKSNSIESLSCMHVIEHIGLGRYGDEIDIHGDLKAMKELTRVLKKRGNLLVVVPVGSKAIYFNAHRVYSHSDIIEGFKDLKLLEFSLIKGSGKTGIIKNATSKMVAMESFACGCYWFTKE